MSLMTLPLEPPFAPMEARLVEAIPEGPQWQYEPKWDGFRCLAFRDGKQVQLQSKSGQPLARYFPEMVAALVKLRAGHFVIDGEIMIPVGGRSSFDDLLQRIHPAASRVKKLAAEHPALFVVFDLLVDEKGKSLVEEPLAARRRKLERFAERFLAANEQIRVSPATTRASVARRWLHGVAGGSLDGIVAKRLDLAYQSGNRDGMQKIKRQRTADCVVGGFRYAERKRVVGSLLLGLYDDQGLLNHVGFTSAFSDAERKRLLGVLRPLIAPPGFSGSAPGGPSRWNNGRSTQWQPLEPKLVVEVQYDHFTGERFRHGTRLLRFRPDKAPGECTYEQIARKGAGLKLLSKRVPSRRS
ncbi:MAG TPA: ATP-dependent DNA ligase [Pirellulales bacterium]|nr:ATP-dependent DNA ligase [Pirellulales bacterium]